ncbi:metalloprotease [Stakelama pacifica]|nr:metalloprotease [Stakelama pacifica]
MAKEEAAPLLSAAQDVISYASGNEPIVLKSGNAVFDRSLAKSLARMTALFGVLPGFAYFDEPMGEGSNAYATSAVRLDRDDGTVLFGTRMLKGLLGRPTAPDAAVLAVCAHEYGHIVQYRRGLSARLNAGQSTVKRQELHADYLAGYFAAVRKIENANFSSVTFATTMYDLGDTAFHSRNHHGTHDERAAAVMAGFSARKERGLTVDQAIADGLNYVGA